MDDILAYASREALFKLRVTTHTFRAQVDRLLFRHVVINLVPSPGIVEVRSPLGHRLPVVPHLLQPSSCKHKIQQAAAVLADAKTIDITCRYDFDFNYWVGWRMKVVQTPILCALGHLSSNLMTVRFLVSWVGLTTISELKTSELFPKDLCALLGSVAISSGHPGASNVFDLGVDEDKSRISPTVFWAYQQDTPPKRCVLNVSFNPFNTRHSYALIHIAWPRPYEAREYVIHFKFDSFLPQASPASGQTLIHSTPQYSTEILARLLDSAPGTSYYFVGAGQLPNLSPGFGGRLGGFGGVPAWFLAQDEYRKQVGEKRFALETALPMPRA